MDRLWQRMAEIFGGYWERNFGELGGPAFETWATGLGDLDLQEIKYGLEVCVKSGTRFPPNLPEFRAMCRPPGHSMAQAYGNNFTGTHALPKPKPSAEVRERELKRQAVILAGPKTRDDEFDQALEHLSG